MAVRFSLPCIFKFPVFYDLSDLLLLVKVFLVKRSLDLISEVCVIELHNYCTVITVEGLCVKLGY